MLSYALLCLLSLHAACSAPVDPSSHILIVTPQAQVHLEPTLRYVHGLSPLARIGLPQHEETIVYVPAGNAASVVPVADVIGSGRANIEAIGLRSGDLSQSKQSEIPGSDQAQQTIAQVQQQGAAIISSGSGALADLGASAAGFFPSGGNTNKLQDKLKTEQIEFIETPANTLPLLPATEARQFYSVAPIYQPHAVELVRAPVYLAPLSAIRARSIQQPELVAIEQKQEAAQQAKASTAPIVPAAPPQEQAPAQPAVAPEPEGGAPEQKPEALPLKSSLKEQPQSLKEQPQTLKEQPQAEAKQQPQQQQKAAFAPESDKISPEIPAAAAPEGAGAGAGAAAGGAGASAGTEGAAAEPDQGKGDIARFLESNAPKEEEKQKIEKPAENETKLLKKDQDQEIAPSLPSEGQPLQPQQQKQIQPEEQSQQQQQQQQQRQLRNDAAAPMMMS